MAWVFEVDLIHVSHFAEQVSIPTFDSYQIQKCKVFESASITQRMCCHNLQIIIGSVNVKKSTSKMKQSSIGHHVEIS